MARVQFTAGRVRDFACPAGKSQAFLWDAEVAGLGLRATPNGKSAYVFQRQHEGKTVRQTIGSPEAWTIEQARTRARELQRLMDTGHNPAEVKRDAQAAKEAERAQREAEAQAQRQQEQRQAVTGFDAWPEYLAEGKEYGFTKRGKWSERHYSDNVELADAGGKPFKRGKGTTAPGPLHSLLSLPLAQIDSEALERWLKDESKKRPARAALAFRLARSFLNWCEGHKVYGAIVHQKAHAPAKVRRLVPQSAGRRDLLQREQLAPWFTAVQAEPLLPAVFLQILLLAGMRKNELEGLRWQDVSLRYGASLTLHDKTEGVRVIPCTPYMAHLLASLPRRGQWVFGDSARPKIAHNASYNHRRALAAAGLPHVTLHGLRRSFGTLAEWAEPPAGVTAQIQGHKPSATREKHYIIRPLDMLRVHHEAIEAWMLEQAGVQFTPQAEPGKLRAVK